MLNVPSPSFPVPNSQQRVSAGGRNKTPLKPGRSLMDWIKLKSSGKDLTGLRGRLIEVTEEELAKHNKKTDCWTCIRGLVYNVTPYMEYHPGGEEELMKAAGIDGTQLFDQVHRWVNYESMLKECLIGRMAVKHASLLKGLTATENPEKTLINGLLPSSAKQEAGKAFKPRYDWFQTDSTVTLVIYTKKKSMFSEMVTVDYQDNILREEITIEDYSYLLHIELSHTVEDFEVCTSSITGKIEVILQKEDHKAWNNLGKSLEGDNSFIKKSQRGMEIVKPYTPVSQDLVIDHIQSTDSEKKYIYLMIKIYTNGSFTPHFDKLEIGDHVSVSSPQGCFRMAQIEGIEDIFLVAAGTGFTPMVKLLKNVLSGSPSLRKVKLIFFNKTEADILWREQLETLRLSDGRFEAQFILSEPSESWVGHKGQISSSLLSEALTRSKEGSSAWICICGPNGFVDQGLRCLEDLGFTQEQLFVFRE
ncbi:cytochrome b5 reductase 4 isoform X2 [Bufo gargarizans]|uniref:cytochrome b5 reductase 4 isoform X2 n=1 Tax=Bufo gargarizans TaxID=30331 RepID=UPI001CF31FC2|nr:cytochrome b5 reductase 4 isoform X2 [Bufo gargarizans]